MQDRRSDQERDEGGELTHDEDHRNEHECPSGRPLGIVDLVPLGNGEREDHPGEPDRDHHEQDQCGNAGANGAELGPLRPNDSDEVETCRHVRDQLLFSSGGLDAGSLLADFDRGRGRSTNVIVRRRGAFQFSCRLRQA